MRHRIQRNGGLCQLSCAANQSGRKSPVWCRLSAVVMLGSSFFFLYSAKEEVERRQDDPILGSLQCTFGKFALPTPVPTTAQFLRLSHLLRLRGVFILWWGSLRTVRQPTRPAGRSTARKALAAQPLAAATRWSHTHTEYEPLREREDEADQKRDATWKWSRRSAHETWLNLSSFRLLAGDDGSLGARCCFSLTPRC